MDEAKLHVTRLFLQEKKNFKLLPIGTFHLLHKYVMIFMRQHYPSPLIQSEENPDMEQLY